MYYCNDPNFFKEVIAKENAPFEFKIHMFSKVQENETKEGEAQQEVVEGAPSQEELHMTKLLMNYDSQDIRVSKMPWTQKEGGQASGRPEPKDKFRFNFTINDGE